MANKYTDAVFRATFPCVPGANGHMLKLVAWVIAQHSDNETGYCFPSYRLIAKEAQIGLRTAKRAVEALVGLGVLSMTSGTRARKGQGTKARHSKKSNGYIVELETLESLVESKKDECQGDTHNECQGGTDTSKFEDDECQGDTHGGQGDTHACTDGTHLGVSPWHPNSFDSSVELLHGDSSDKNGGVATLENLEARATPKPTPVQRHLSWEMLCEGCHKEPKWAGTGLCQTCQSKGSPAYYEKLLAQTKSCAENDVALPM